MRWARINCRVWLLGACLLSLGISVSADTPRLEDLATSAVKDLQATVVVIQSDQTELEKINRDFGMAYRLKELTMRCKEPNKLRMEGRIGLYIVNDTTRFFRIPQLRLTRRENIATVPAKHYSLQDIGLLTQCSLKHLTSRFLRTENLDDKTTHVFSFQPNDDRSSRYTAWIDPQTHAILKREWYDAAGKLRATFVYRNIQEVAPGIWVPTRIEILNGTGTVAAITEYRNLRVNQGIADSVFEIE